jgi:hypothetical protein
VKSFFTLLVIAAMFGALIWQYHASVLALEKHKLLVQDQSVLQGLEKQNQCAEQVFAVFRQRSQGHEEPAAWKGHYNPSLGKCFGQIETGTLTQDIAWHNVTVFDAATRIEVAGYSSRTSPGQKESEVIPFTCEVTLPSDARIDCYSRAEFMDKIKAYMQ